MDNYSVKLNMVNPASFDPIKLKICSGKDKTMTLSFLYLTGIIFCNFLQSHNKERLPTQQNSFGFSYISMDCFLPKNSFKTF